MRLSKIFLIIFSFLIAFKSFSREGMWLPVLVEQMNYTELQAAGFKLSAEDIYSINNACLKDAIVLFGRGCTGGIVSNEGLLFTNHHCGAGQIARHSTVDNNYLLNGFWAMNQSEELSNPGLTVKILSKMIDFTDKILKDVPANLSYTEEQAHIEKLILNLEKSIEDTSDFKAIIESFYSGNNYYLFLYTEYSDVRLVGCPPESIASFGGDTDNWVWPRHAADFSVFRIYTAPDGKPAVFSTENIPLQPQKYFSISAKGVQPGDFTMVMGFPGRTSRDLYSGELENIFNTLYPMRIKLRDGRLDIINKARSKSDKIYLQYASKQSGISNGWKKWKGVLYGFQRFNVLEKREVYEKWLIDNAGNKKAKLKEMYDMFYDSYNAFKPYAFTMDYFTESVFEITPINFCADVSSVVFPIADKPLKPEEVSQKLNAYKNKYFSSYDLETEKALTKFLLLNFKNDVDEMYVPTLLKSFKSGSGLENYIEKIYSTSVFTDSVRYKKAMKAALAGKNKLFISDPIFILFSELRNIYSNELVNDYFYYKDQYESLYREYIPLIRSIDTARKFYPDANLTLRFSYGSVSGYSPSDAVEYDFQTYIDGLFQKSAQGTNDYKVPARLEELYNKKDFAPYSDSLGRLPLCFVASNHTSGGNSGSPVLNGEGKLIGLNFDRTWESTMSDFYFDDSICRNIAVDSRYILYMIDKYAGAGYLLKEMDIEW